jgi:hypothetical protein
MSQWSVMAPHASMSFVGEQGVVSSFSEDLEKLAGVKYKRGRWTVPLNAIPVVVDKAQQSGLKVSAQWVIEPHQDKEWHEIEPALFSW